MDAEEYLRKVLSEQNLAEDSEEMRALEKHQKDIQELLQDNFGSVPKLREGGSKAKGSMIKECYDLDLPYYFPRDDDGAGATIEEIYEGVEKVLQEKYR